MIKLIGILLLVASCTSVAVPSDYVYKEIKTRDFTLATWQKITNPTAVYKIYIEGDGYAFNSYGKPTQDPTPKGTFVRKLAFGDNSPNVIYLARPCQYIKSPICSKRLWTTARFAPEIINAEFDAINQITAKNGLNIKKIITVAGNLDHLSWTQYHNLPPLNESMNLESYQTQFANIPQIHYVGSDDKVVPPVLTRKFISNDDLIVEVDGASHNEGWESIYQAVWSEK